MMIPSTSSYHCFVIMVLVDLIGWHLLGSPGNIEECMQTIQPVKYGEEVCFNGIFVLKASSSGLELGNSVWTIKGPNTSITYLPSAVFVSAHALDFDYSSLKENDVILFSDLSSLNEMDEDTEKLDEHAMDETDPSLRRHSVLRYSSFCTSVLPEIHV